MAFALEITDLKKIYPGGVEALKGISFAVNEGDFYALLGPNGAGSRRRLRKLAAFLACAESLHANRLLFMRTV